MEVLRGDGVSIPRVLETNPSYLVAIIVDGEWELPWDDPTICWCPMCAPHWETLVDLMKWDFNDET
jgi:hypothetical protein